MIEYFNSISRPKMVVMEYPIELFESQMKNGSARLACIGDMDFVNSRLDSNETFIILEEYLLRAQMGFGFEKNHFMLHLTDKIVGELIPSGILQHSYDYHWFFTDMKDKPEELGPQVLRVTDLSFGFVLWLIACSISTAVFVVEWLIPRVKRIIRTAVGLVLFLQLLRQRLNVVY
jgi:hypothetical protein